MLSLHKCTATEQIVPCVQVKKIEKSISIKTIKKPIKDDYYYIY